MKWVEPREPLVPGVHEFSSFTNKFDKWNSVRKAVLIKRNNICRFCGGTFNKYLTVIPIDKNTNNKSTDNLDICCRACYMITHLNYGVFRQLLVIMSKLSQVDIVRKSLEYLTKHGITPSVDKIDPNAKKVPISLLEYISLINEPSDNIPEIIKHDYKICFSSNVDTGFINTNRYGTESMFDESIDNEESDLPPDYELAEHVLTKDEITFINNHFNTNIL